MDVVSAWGNGPTGAVIAALMSVVVVLWRALDKSQNARIRESKEVTKDTLTTMNEMNRVIAALSNSVEKMR